MSKSQIFIKNYVFLTLFLLLSFSCGYESSNGSTQSIETTVLNALHSEEPNGVEKVGKYITFPALVARIVDGDTAELLYKDTPFKVRLAHIDCPETYGEDQPYGTSATLMIKKLCFNEIVTVRTTMEFDRYGRMIAVLIDKNGLNINKEMVRSGYAWHYKKYSDDMSYDRLEREARSYKRGLWKGENPIAPWEFRKNQ